MCLPVSGHTWHARICIFMTATVLPAGAPSAGAQAQAYLLLSQLRMPTTHQVADRQAIGSAPAHVEVQPCLASRNNPGIEELLEKALVLAPQHSASAVHAWRLFGDWMYFQRDMAVSEAPEQRRLHALSAARLKAAEAYCQAVRHAAGSTNMGSTMSALLRVLQASIWSTSHVCHVAVGGEQEEILGTVMTSQGLSFELPSIRLPSYAALAPGR